MAEPFEVFPPPDFVPTGSAVEGIEIYKPAPPQAEHRPVVEFKCPRCGSSTAYSVADGGLICTHCDYYEAPQQPVVGKGAEEFEFKVETMARAAHGWGEARKELQCQGCGAYTSVPVEMLTHTCPFCNSSKVIQREAPQDVLRPRFLISFKVDDQNCRQITRTWLGSSWMTPKELSQVAMLGQFNGVYLPYWTFDTTLNAHWKAEVGRTETERHFEDGEWKTRTKTVWEWKQGRVSHFVDDLVIGGSERLSQRLLGQINPFDLHQLTPYEPQYLAGLQAQSYDVPLERAWEVGRHQMRETARRLCHLQINNSRVRNFSMELDFADESWRYILLPVYVAAYHYGTQVYQILINGQSGAIAGQRPVDRLKVGLVCAGLIAPGMVLGLVGVILAFYNSPNSGWLMIGGIVFVIGLLIAAKLIVDAMRLDDA